MAQPRRKILDGILVGVSVAVAAFLLAAQVVESESTRRVSAQDVRSLELPARVAQVSESLPPEVREVLRADPAEALPELYKMVDDAAPWAQELRLVLSSIAVSFGRDEDALAQLDKLAEAPGGVDGWRPSVESLYALARGEPAPDLDALTKRLEAMGATPWLTGMVAARHQANAGDAAAAEAQRAAAEASSLQLVERLALATFVVFGLGFLGLALLLVWPLFLGQMVRTRLGGGLVGTASPFDFHSTTRVMVGWFLTFTLAGIALSLSFQNVSAKTFALLIAVQTLVHGGVAIALMQRYGRAPGDTRPLADSLRLGARASAGGRPGFFLWVLGGLGVALVVTFFASLVSSQIFGAQDRPQTALELFTDAGPDARLFIGVSVVLFAPVLEEVLFRGFLYRNLRDRLGPAFAGLASGALFGLVHFDPHLLLPLTALGATLAWLYEQSGSLLVPISVHAIWNGSQLVLILLLMG